MPQGSGARVPPVSRASYHKINANFLAPYYHAAGSASSLSLGDSPSLRLATGWLQRIHEYCSPNPRPADLWLLRHWAWPPLSAKMPKGSGARFHIHMLHTASPMPNDDFLALVCHTASSPSLGASPSLRPAPGRRCERCSPSLRPAGPWLSRHWASLPLLGPPTSGLFKPWASSQCLTTH